MWSSGTAGCADVVAPSRAGPSPRRANATKTSVRGAAAPTAANARGEREHRGGPGRVVVGAGVNLPDVAGRERALAAAAEMVVVRADDDRLLPPSRIVPRRMPTTLAVVARSRIEGHLGRTSTAASANDCGASALSMALATLGDGPSRGGQDRVGGAPGQAGGQDAVGASQATQGREVVLPPARGWATSRIARAPCSRALMILCVRCE